jgi:hypothetical protein
MSLSQLTRTCHLTDFGGCRTPAAWQQRFVDEVYQRWWPATEADLHAAHLLMNMSGADFTPLPEVAPALRLLSTPAAFLRYPTLQEVASIVALSVLDHIESPVSFLRHASMDLRPEGLLVATAAYWDAEGPDIATGHEHRLRIYNRTSWRKLIVEAERWGLHPFGGIDWTYHGHTLGDSTLMSLVLTKGATR